MRSLIKFSLPLILSGMLQQLYNWADAFIVGNVEGEGALAAIGATSSLTNFFITLMTGFTLGLSVLIARKYGEKNVEDIPKITSAFAVISFGVFLTAAVLCAVFATPLLKLLETTPDTIELAADYVTVIFAGFPFLALYNVFSASLRGIGDSKTPFYSIVVSSAVNVVLDIIFVAVLKKGVTGAAVATVISQVVMTAFTVIYSNKKHPLTKFSFAKSNFDGKLLAEGAKYGLPPMLQSCVTSLGSLVLQNFMNGFGTPTVTAITTAYRIDTLVMLPIINLGSGIATFTSQSYGEGNKKKTSKILLAGLILSLAVSVLLTVAVIPTGGKLIALFGAGEEAVGIGTEFFFNIACFYPIFGASTALRGYIEGAGDLAFSSFVGILTLVIRIVASYIMEPFFGNSVISYAEMIAWVIMLILYIVRSTYVRKKLFAEKDLLEKTYVE